MAPPRVARLVYNVQFKGRPGVTSHAQLYRVSVIGSAVGDELNGETRSKRRWAGDARFRAKGIDTSFLRRNIQRHTQAS